MGLIRAVATDLASVVCRYLCCSMMLTSTHINIHEHLTGYRCFYPREHVVRTWSDAGYWRRYMPHHGGSSRPHRRLGMALLCLAVALPLDAHGAAVRQARPPRQSTWAAFSFTSCVLRTVTVGASPGVPALDPKTGRVFVGAAHRLSVLDARTGALLRTIHGRIGGGSLSSMKATAP
jgi:hypothetical protein